MYLKGVLLRYVLLVQWAPGLFDKNLMSHIIRNDAWYETEYIVIQKIYIYIYIYMLIRYFSEKIEKSPQIFWKFTTLITAIKIAW